MENGRLQQSNISVTKTALNVVEKSTTYNRNMKHGDKFIGPCRNLNVTTVKKL